MIPSLNQFQRERLPSAGCGASPNSSTLRSDPHGDGVVLSFSQLLLQNGKCITVLLWRADEKLMFRKWHREEVVWNLVRRSQQLFDSPTLADKDVGCRRYYQEQNDDTHPGCYHPGVVWVVS